MLATYRRLILPSALLAMIVACNDAQTTHDMTIASMDEQKARFGAQFTHMVDNAALHDMSVADIHFIPHTAEISGVGEVRLNRMAKLLNTYGGTVRYETLLGDDELIGQRLAHVREYLALTGCNMERVQVTTMMSGGRGMPGDEAVAKFRKGTKEEAGESSSTTLTPAELSPGQ